MNEKRRAYTEAETESLLKLCRRNGYGMNQALNMFRARTPLSEVRALEYGEPHPDAGIEPHDCPHDGCPHKKDDVPADTPKGDDKSAASSWDVIIAQIGGEK